MAIYTKDQYEIAKNADYLAQFLLYSFPDEYIKIGKNVYKRYFDEYHLSRGRTYDKSLPITINNCGYQDFAHTEDRGSPIDYLIEHENFIIPDAVIALAEYGADNGHTERIIEKLARTKVNNDTYPDDGGTTTDGKDIILPPKTKPKALFAHMCQYRGIPYKTVKWLVDKGLLYETVLTDKDGRKWHNMVFLNRDQTRAEIKQTVTFGNFKNNSLFCHKDDYWSIGGGKKIYVCESAVDAISLFELRQEQAKYVSLASVTNTAIMERLKKEARENGQQLILAVDADQAGMDFRNKYPNYIHIDPINENIHAKDWSDLLRIKKGLKKIVIQEDVPW